MSKGWEQFLIVIVVVVALPFVVFFGVYGYVRITAKPLHPDLSSVGSVAGSAPASRWTAAVEEARGLVREALVEQNLPGLSVAVGVDGDIAWAEGFGWADLEERVPVTPELRFRLGGASIALTSAAVGLLLEEERLGLDEPIRTYVPSFPEKPWPVTLRDLMAHVAGIRHNRGEEDFMPSGHCERAVEGLDAFAEDRLRFQPGSSYEFSLYGWILVSAAVEAAANEPFFDFLRARVLEPLGMHATIPDSPAEPVPDVVTFYYPRFGAETRYGPQVASTVDYSCFAGACGLLSTPSDLVRFGLALGRGELLRPSTVDLLQAPQRLASGEETGYGLGWDLETVSLAGEPARLVGHDGELFMGGSTSFVTWPTRGIVAAVVSNTSYADTSSLAWKIVETFAEAASPASDEPASTLAEPRPR
jgi:CubicO group peptidase (beta-lactamase class C family)